MARHYYITPEDITAAEQNGITKKRLEERVRKLGWNVDKAVNTPLQKGNRWNKWKETAEKNGISHKLFNQRICVLGLEPEEAATTPKGGFDQPRKFSIEITEKAKHNGISRNTFYSRARHGWSAERAATTPIIKKYSSKYREEVNK